MLLNALAGSGSFSMAWYCVKPAAIGSGNVPDLFRSRRRPLGAQQQQREQGGEAERGGDDQDPASHGVDQKSERQWGGRLRHPRRRADDAKPIAIIFRAEDRQRQRAARNGQDTVAQTEKDRERT